MSGAEERIIEGFLLVSLKVYILNLKSAFQVTVTLIICGYGAIAHCSDAYHSDSYQDTVERLCGKASLVICSTLIFIHNFGTCITLLVLLADQIDSSKYFIAYKHILYNYLQC